MIDQRPMIARQWLFAGVIAAVTISPLAARAEAPSPPNPDAAKPQAEGEAPVETPERRAARWLREGNKAFREGRFADAEAAYREAFALKRGFDIAGDLAMAQLAQGKLRDAAEHFTFSLRQYPITGEPALRDEMMKALEKARQAISVIKVGVDVKDAQLLIDGAPLGDAQFADEIYVEPGEHTIEARRAGYQTVAHRIRAERGGRAEAMLRLVPLSDAAPGRDQTEPEKKRSLIPAYVLSGVAAAGVGAGAVLLGVSAAQRGDATELKDAISDQNHDCNPGGGRFDSRCADLKSKWDSVYTARDVGIASLVVGGAAAAGALAYVLWPAPKKGTSSVTPLVGAGFLGLAASF